jgi:hypothetical protein
MKAMYISEMPEGDMVYLKDYFQIGLVVSDLRSLQFTNYPALFILYSLKSSI